MKKPNIELSLPVGNISTDSNLGAYYQDFTEAIEHFEKCYFGSFDENGIPLAGFGDEAYYNLIYIVQYGIILHDLILKGENIEKNKLELTKCFNWIDQNKIETEHTIYWENEKASERYDLPKNWISGMYQGQAISLYLRYGQLFNCEAECIEKTKKMIKFYDVDFKNGGFKRIDDEGNLWFEEYTSPSPSFVLNGYIYSLFGVYDYWRVTNCNDAKHIIDECEKTLANSLHKYDCGYWSIYDQLIKELATKYYHKNIHIPIMEIMYGLTQNELFNYYKKRWEKQYNSKINHIFVEIMYRVRPRMKLFLKK